MPGREVTVPVSTLIAKFPSELIGDRERDALDSALTGIASYRRTAEIVKVGKPSPHLHLVLRGWAAGEVSLENGSRQITGLFLVGNFCDLPTLDGSSATNVFTLTDVEVGLFHRKKLLSALQTLPRLGLAFLSLVLAEQALLRTWMVCFGAQKRVEHVAHLFCELHQRLVHAGMTSGGAFDLPLTQNLLAETTGMTPVHVNRVLKRLRNDGLIRLHNKRLEILDLARLRKLAGFDSTYLPGDIP